MRNDLSKFRQSPCGRLLRDLGGVAIGYRIFAALMALAGVGLFALVWTALNL